MMDPNDCEHEEIWQGMCTHCGAEVEGLEDLGSKQAGQQEQKGYVPVIGWGQDKHGLVVRQSAALKTGDANNQRLRCNRQLALIVDLDKTVLHTTVQSGAEYLYRDGISDLFEFQLANDRHKYYTKLRPGVQDFLAAMQPMYEMHVYTMGTRQYAEAILKFLDPEREFFKNRILTKDESFDVRTKCSNLDVLFPSGDNLVAIIDDTPGVWSYRPNLVCAYPYTYFSFFDAREVNALPGDKQAKPSLSYETAIARSLVYSQMKIPGEIEDKLSTRYSDALVDIVRFCILEEAARLYEWHTETSSLEQNLAALCESVGTSVDVTVIQAWAIEMRHLRPASKEESEEMVKETRGSETVQPTDDAIARAVHCVDAAFAGMDVTYELVHIHLRKPRATNDDAAASEQAKFKRPSKRKRVTNSAASDWVVVQTSARLPTEGDLQVLKFLQDCLPVLESPRGQSWTPGATWRGNFSYWTSAIVRDKSVDRALDAVRDRLSRNQLPAAVALVRMFRVLLPAQQWTDVSDFEVMKRFLSTLRAFKRVPYPIRPIDDDGMLSLIGQALEKVHKEFYASPDKDESVARILQRVKEDYKMYPPWCLTGVRIVFSSVIPTGHTPHHHPMWMFARSLGAECETSLSKETTHLVARTPLTDKVKTGRKMPGLIIVTPEWLHECQRIKNRADENKFLLPLPPTRQRERHDKIETLGPATHPQPMEQVEEDVEELVPVTISQSAWDEMDKEMEEFLGDSSDDDDNDDDDDDDADPTQTNTEINEKGRDDDEDSDPLEMFRVGLEGFDDDDDDDDEENAYESPDEGADN